MCVIEIDRRTLTTHTDSYTTEPPSNTNQPPLNVFKGFAANRAHAGADKEREEAMEREEAD